MLEGLVHDAKSAASSVVSKYAVRASVVVPFAIALGLATAAMALLLIEQFSVPTAFFILAAGYAIIGLVAAILVTGQEHRVDVAEDKAVKAAQVETSKSNTASVVTAAEQLPLGLIGALLTSGAGQESVQKLIRALERNAPLLLALSGLAVLLWPNSKADIPVGADRGAGSEVPKSAPNGQIETDRVSQGAHC